MTVTVWVYIQTERSLWTVGFYRPDGSFEPDSDHGSREDAAKRVHYLNGGNPEPEEPEYEDPWPNDVDPAAAYIDTEE